MYYPPSSYDPIVDGQLVGRLYPLYEPPDVERYNSSTLLQHTRSNTMAMLNKLHIVQPTRAHIGGDYCGPGLAHKRFYPPGIASDVSLTDAAVASIDSIRLLVVSTFAGNRLSGCVACLSDASYSSAGPES
ncbi:hypothetical protein HYE67_006521 [Fusarium culmorum]|uniref:Uncharacterized protein n=1 Tax=Fusarium culmorum TaxID=5516 RepID=A0A2T4H2M1_FUSCU|nr:hypothetical protein FCULG_00007504 [Fusarium culmorum]QPC64290.1 hypothetical protein HYE67_006521 [Fusarium culmorum]